MADKIKHSARKNTLHMHIAPSRPVGSKAALAAKVPGDAPDGRLIKVEGGEKYRLGRIVAEGGMGMIQQAEDLKCQRVVAMKVIRKGRKVTREEQQRFMEEARITAQLEHPNIVPVHELGTDEEANAYYTMKFVKGSTLTDILLAIRRGDAERIERYPLPRLLNVFQKVCDAIAFAHSKGVVHCDLKPDNVMVCDFGEVVVMDWGLARMTGREGEGSGPGKVVGTPGFLAPERMLRGGGVSTKTDIYSLGAMLYSILALRPPLAGSDTVEILRRVVRGEIAPPASYNSPNLLKQFDDKQEVTVFPHCPEGRIPGALSEIAMKAMSTDPAERYATVEELQDDVAAYQNGLIWHLAIEEDFSKADFLDRWEIVGGQWEIRDGELRMHGGEPQLLIFKQDVPGDVRIEFTAHQESAYLNDLSCFISARRTGNLRDMPFSGYEFKYGGYENSMNLLVRGDRRLWNEVGSPIVRGKKYQVRAERVGGKLSLTVNNEKIFRVTDPDPLSGADRTGVGLFGWVADTRISRVRVYTLGAPWKADIIDLAERQVQKGRYEMAIAMYEEALASFPDRKRLARAQKGLDAAYRSARWRDEMPALRERLEKAWPNAKFNVGMDTDGLRLDIADAGIDSLEPLRGLPVRALYCSNNSIASLEPLRGMQLVTLYCSGNPIEDLEPLRGMPLTSLWCECCQIADFEPLRGMALTMLIAGGNRVKDLAPLAGMPLTNLSVWGNQIESLEPLRGMSLSMLYCNANRIRSLEPLRDMLLVTLNCSGNQIEDLSPLSGMPLKTLHMAQNRVSSLDPLRNMRLSMLTCTGNPIVTLSPLRSMRLDVLMCGNTSIKNVDPLIEHPPGDFLFDSESLSTSELQKIHAYWCAMEDKGQLVRSVESLLRLRRDEEGKLRKLAAEFKGRRYLYLPKFLTWEKARLYCEQLGGHLLTITSREEQEFVESLFPSGCWTWLGLEVMGNGLSWVSGEPVDYLNFVDRLQERKSSPKVFAGRWSADDNPSAENTFVVEWPDG